jgi:hypothetical protein
MWAGVKKAAVGKGVSLTIETAVALAVAKGKALLGIP